MPKRPLPQPAAAALEIIVEGRSRDIRAHDLELRMHQRGFNGRGMLDALRAFERRGWLLRSDSVVEISKDAFDSEPVTARRKSAAPRRQRTRMPRGLFGD